jgi:hypothetical protein
LPWAPGVWGVEGGRGGGVGPSPRTALASFPRSLMACIHMSPAALWNASLRRHNGCHIAVAAPLGSTCARTRAQQERSTTNSAGPNSRLAASAISWRIEPAFIVRCSCLSTSVCSSQQGAEAKPQYPPKMQYIRSLAWCKPALTLLLLYCLGLAAVYALYSRLPDLQTLEGR